MSISLHVDMWEWASCGPHCCGTKQLDIIWRERLRKIRVNIKQRCVIDEPLLYIEREYFYKRNIRVFINHFFVQTRKKLSMHFCSVYFNHPVIPRIFHVFMKIRAITCAMMRETRIYLFISASDSFCQNAILEFHTYILFLGLRISSTVYFIEKLRPTTEVDPRPDDRSSVGLVS